MNRRTRLLHTAVSVLLTFTLGFSLEGLADPPSGIQPLESLPHDRALLTGEPIHTLLTAADQERFLNELEKQPPDWNQLHDPPGEELGTRLFDFNRQRDALREEHPLMRQRVAFWWSGVLGEYREAHRGFSVVMGPEFTQTTWGLVRFKPLQLPHEMVAVPSEAGLRTLLERHAKGEPVEIGILFTGTLIPWESIIYAFSHDGMEQGLIMPVVQVDGVRYFFRPLSD
ncbi:MAG: hypothetical protein F4Z24_06605 [Nitrospira sp. SB0666_bin_27]|nr:hypothetical protein [Nitrospira sp. SB0666_bin_27]MYF23712.1 hypothetical protein [Nitrospira sp. SB0678_bin_10]